MVSQSIWTIDVIFQTLRKNVIVDYKKTEVKTFLKLVCIRTILCVFIFVNMTFVCVQDHNYGCWVKI